MKTSCIARIFSSVSLFAALILLSAAQTDPASANETLADSLLPLETRSVGIQADPERFNAAANEINASYQNTSAESDDTGVLGAGFLEGLVDENGNFDLPMGITVFDAMGTTSVGFGSSF